MALSGIQPTSLYSHPSGPRTRVPRRGKGPTQAARWTPTRRRTEVRPPRRGWQVLPLSLLPSQGCRTRGATPGHSHPPSGYRPLEQTLPAPSPRGSYALRSRRRKPPHLLRKRKSGCGSLARGGSQHKIPEKTVARRKLCAAGNRILCKLSW